MVVWLFWYFDLQLKVSKVTEPPRKQTNKNKNIQTKTQQAPTQLLTCYQSLSEICFKRSGVNRWTLAFKRGTVAACRSGIAEEELFGKWESSIDGSISTSAGNSMARGVQGRWDIVPILFVLFSLGQLVCWFGDYILYFWNNMYIYIYIYVYIDCLVGFV